MGDGLGLGYSKIAASEYRRTTGDRLKRVALFLVAFVLLGIFFFYLTKEVQTSTARATGDSGVDWDGVQ